jgi:hypothetical protein
MREEGPITHRAPKNEYKMTMEDLASTLSLQPGGAVAARNNGGRDGNSANVALTSARLRVSKVLKRLKKPKWRKRHSTSSTSASDALEAVSESDSVCSGVDSSLTSTCSESFDNPVGGHTNNNSTSDNFFSGDDDGEADVTQRRLESRSRKCTSMVVYEPSRSTTRTSPSGGLKISRTQSLPESLDTWGKTFCCGIYSTVRSLLMICNCFSIGMRTGSTHFAFDMHLLLVIQQCRLHMPC